MVTQAKQGARNAVMEPGLRIALGRTKPPQPVPGHRVRQGTLLATTRIWWPPDSSLHPSEQERLVRPW